MTSIVRRRAMPALSSLIALTALALAGCGDGGAPLAPQTPPAVASVAVSPSAHTLAEGGTVALQATPKDADGASVSRVVAWTTSDGAIASVTQQGIVTAVSEGTATITATADGKAGEAMITVTPAAAPAPAVAAVTLDADEATLDEGETRQLVATPRDAQGEPIEGLGMQWTSSDEGIARVGALGLVTAIRPGTVTITVTVHGKTAQAAVAVTAQYGFDLLYGGPGDDEAWESFRLDIRDAEAARVRVSPAGAWAGTPRPSPDGSLLAFTGRIDGVHGIYIANADGTAPRLLVGADAGVVGEATWSPDGTRLAYTRQATPSTQPEVWVVDADGTDAASLTAGLGGSGQAMPAWSPALGDGTSRIAFAHDVNGTPSIWSMRPDGSDKRQLTEGAADIQPAWSPDGATIAFQRTTAAIVGDLWLVDADGANERGLVTGLAGSQWAPAWSPDGRLVAFASEHETFGQGLEDEIYTVWADGSKLARRTSGGARTPAWIVR
ncbi:MAG TPA: Ig-like domain-containing protein [Gemmatimonadaceae bacterium]